MKKKVSKSRKHATTSTDSRQQDGASSGRLGLRSSWKTAAAGSTAVAYLKRTLQKHSYHFQRDGGGPEPAAILHERTRWHTPPSASSTRKGAQSARWVRKAQDAARYGESRTCWCPALTLSQSPCKTGACACPRSATDLFIAVEARRGSPYIISARCASSSARVITVLFPQLSSDYTRSRRGPGSGPTL